MGFLTVTRLGNFVLLFALFFIPAQALHGAAVVLVSLLQRSQPPIRAGAVNFNALKDKLPPLNLLWIIALERFPAKVVAEITIGDEFLYLWGQVAASICRCYKREDKNNTQQPHNVQFEGLRAFAQSLSNARLRISELNLADFFQVHCLLGMP